MSSGDENGNRPLWVGQLDIANPPDQLGPIESSQTRYEAARLLIRFQGEPIGMLTAELTDNTVDIAATRATAASLFADQIAKIAKSKWTPGSEPLSTLSHELEQVQAEALPAISVVIGTRQRPEQVIDCINLVFKQDYPSPIEVIVVHNGGDGTPTAAAIDASFGGDERIRYLEDARPGLSRARNIGLSAARFPITAFLSDDIRVDPLWLLGIARGFARHEDVHCVTGFCPPMYLDTAEQLMFESSMAWGTRQGFEPVLYEYNDPNDPVHPYRAGSYVNGSNMVYDTKVFRAMGGFDENLGPGTVARGGEDLDAPVRILANGGLIAFEPSVIGWHADRYEDRSFGKHMYTYGLGLTAFLAKHITDRATRREVIGRIPKGFPMLLQAFGEPDEELHDTVGIPAKYHASHHAGRFAGPVAYLKSRFTARR